MKHCYRVGQGTKLVLEQGDLTAWEGDAIVNAANERMLGGGGVDGAIHRAAGDELYHACLEVIPTPPNSRCRCPTGEARITAGFDLPARFVIHTVGPVYEDEEESEPLLTAAHRNSFKLAKEHGLKSIAFCAISTGVYGYPIPDAAQVAMRAVEAEAAGLEVVAFVLFSKAILHEYVKAAAERFPVWEPTPGSAAVQAAQGARTTDSPTPMHTTDANTATPMDISRMAPQPDAMHTATPTSPTAAPSLAPPVAAPAAPAGPVDDQPMADVMTSGTPTSPPPSPPSAAAAAETAAGADAPPAVDPSGPATAGSVADAKRATTSSNLKRAAADAVEREPHAPPSGVVLREALAAPPETACAVAPALAARDSAEVPSPPHTPTPVQPQPTGCGQPTPGEMDVPTKSESEMPDPDHMAEEHLAPGQEPLQCDSSTEGQRQHFADATFDD
ncbi:MAG: hypothetical protein WDW38_011296 [Sanguina aurantia]